MAVYNEAETVSTAIDSVLGRRHPRRRRGARRGREQLVRRHARNRLRYADDPRVRLVLQDTARGKGAAVREGFAHATGDIILIQDADLEYSVEDYPKLIAPIVRGDVDFTLGCRHVPGQSVRVMEKARVVAPVMNTAHWAFTWLFNVTYRTRLRDPFTMYKVFRRECIEEVEFVADRFDFDWELAGKLVRLGYRPIEIPVEYQARSFHGGKKVRFFRDPPTWIAACIRFRFCSLPDQGLRPASAERRDPVPTQCELVRDRAGDALDG